MRYEATAEAAHWSITESTTGVLATEPMDIEEGDVLVLPGIGNVTIDTVLYVDPKDGDVDGSDYITVVSGDDDFIGRWWLVIDMNTLNRPGLAVTMSHEGAYPEAKRWAHQH